MTLVFVQSLIATTIVILGDFFHGFPMFLFVACKSLDNLHTCFCLSFILHWPSFYLCVSVSKLFFLEANRERARRKTQRRSSSTWPMLPPHTKDAKTTTFL